MESTKQKATKLKRNNDQIRTARKNNMCVAFVLCIFAGIGPAVADYSRQHGDGTRRESKKKTLKRVLKLLSKFFTKTIDKTFLI